MARMATPNQNHVSRSRCTKMRVGSNCFGATGGLPLEGVVSRSVTAFIDLERWFCRDRFVDLPSGKMAGDVSSLNVF